MVEHGITIGTVIVWRDPVTREMWVTGAVIENNVADEVASDESETDESDDDGGSLPEV